MGRHLSNALPPGVALGEKKPDGVTLVTRMTRRREPASHLVCRYCLFETLFYV